MLSFAVLTITQLDPHFLSVPKNQSLRSFTTLSFFFNPFIQAFSGVEFHLKGLCLTLLCVESHFKTGFLLKPKQIQIYCHEKCLYSQAGVKTCQIKWAF